MVKNNPLGIYLGSLFERKARSAEIAARSIEDKCRALLKAEGEVSGVTLAQSILEDYVGFDSERKRAFFLFLNDELELDPSEVSAAVNAFGASNSPADYRRLMAVAEPPRQQLLRRLNLAPGGTRALVRMREDLASFLSSTPDLARTDDSFVHLLRSWFNRGFLQLQQISWDTPASILEKIIAYEAVHAINDWDDLRRRLQPADRRCFAYFHPSMPDEPLVFVEVALTNAVPGSVQRLLSEKREELDPSDMSVAVFYSISNCQKGLKGVSFGNFLIKHVVSELCQQTPTIEQFVTLSPIPGLNKWLQAHSDDHDAKDILDGRALAGTVTAWAEKYLIDAKTARGQPLDPVARFHLGNGAQIFAVHADADVSNNGRAQSSGAMVNYHYDLDLIEQNHERFVENGEVTLAPELAAERLERTKRAKKALAA